MYIVKKRKALIASAFIGSMVILAMTGAETHEILCSGPGPSFTIFVDNAEGNTGLAFNRKENLLVHGRYNYALRSSIVLSDFEGNHIREIDVTSLIDHIQGVTYNWDDDTYFIWGTEKGIPHKPWSTGIELLEVDTTGGLLQRIKLDKELNYPGMLAYSGKHSMWVKPNGSRVAYKFNTESWTVIAKLNTRVKGEGVAVDGEGNLWVHDGRYVVKVDSSTGRELARYRSPTKHGESEGVAVDSFGRVWVSADEGLHNSEPLGNKVWSILPDACTATSGRPDN
jgi:hypothetical protein